MKVFRWIIFSILLPLSPMFLAVVILIGQGKIVQYERIFGGTEIYILSVTVLASTKNDLDNSEIDFSRFGIYNILTVLLIPITIFFSMMFGAIFINQHVQDFGLPGTFIANLGIFLGIMATVLCVPLQVLLLVTEKPGEGE